MTITRRGAIAALVSYVSVLTGRASAQDTFTTSPGVALRLAGEPLSLRFNLATYSAYTFTYGDRTVTLTPDEMIDALQETKP